MAGDPPAYVLDSFALLAYLEGEAGMPRAIDQLPLAIVDVSRSTVLAAAHIKARFPISYADAFAVVAAQDRRAVVVTGDPEFPPLADAGVVTVEWLPRRRR